MQIRETPDSETCWTLLERIASSTSLKRSSRLQELLFYIGKRSLKDGCDRVYEQEIGAKVFHRPTSYDTSADNIVRTNVSDLRKRIEMYFNSEGSHESVIMEIPRGSYIPVFRFRPVESSSEAEGDPAPATDQATPIAVEAPVRPYPLWMAIALAVFATLTIVLAVGCVIFWSRYRALHQPLYAWQSKPAVAQLWSRFLNADPTTDIVISDTGMGLAEAISRKTFSLNDYLSRNYVTQLQSAEMSPDLHAAVNRVLAWNLANPDEFLLARRILALDPLGKTIHLYNARNYTPDLLQQDNVILIGARKSNPWDEIFDSQMSFITEFDNPRVINRAPEKGEQALYVPAENAGYCVVAFLPNPNHSGQVMLIEGTNAEATEAAGDFLLSEDQMAAFMKMLHVSELPYFQVLLKVSEVRGAPLFASIEAYRAGPVHR